MARKGVLSEVKVLRRKLLQQSDEEMYSNGPVSVRVSHKNLKRKMLSTLAGLESP